MPATARGDVSARQVAELGPMKPCARPAPDAMFLIRWSYTSPHYREHAQISSGPGGLVSALANMRAGIAEGDLAWATIAHHPSGELVYDSRTGLDHGPTCARCADQARCRCYTAGPRTYYMRTTAHDAHVQAACVCGWEGPGRWDNWWAAEREFDAHTCLAGAR